jgi:hypothetical protein
MDRFLTGGERSALLQLSNGSIAAVDVEHAATKRGNGFKRLSGLCGLSHRTLANLERRGLVNLSRRPLPPLVCWELTIAITDDGRSLLHPEVAP